MNEKSVGLEDKITYSGEWLRGNGDIFYVATDGDSNSIDFRPDAYTTDASLKYNKNKLRKVYSPSAWKKAKDMLWVDPVIMNSTEGKKFMDAYVTRMTTSLRPYRTYTAFTDTPLSFNAAGYLTSLLSSFANGNAWNQWAGVSIKLLSVQLTYTMGWNPAASSPAGTNNVATVYIGQNQTVATTKPLPATFWQKTGVVAADNPMINPMTDLKSDIRKDWTELYRRTTVLGGNLEPNMLETVQVYIDCNKLNTVNFGSTSAVLSGDLYLFLIAGNVASTQSPQFIGQWLVKYITQ